MPDLVLFFVFLAVMAAFALASYTAQISWPQEYDDPPPARRSAIRSTDSTVPVREPEDWPPVITTGRLRDFERKAEPWQTTAKRLRNLDRRETR
jgi:hypothetical protein